LGFRTSYTLVAACWSCGEGQHCLVGIRKQGNFCGVAMDFIAGLCHVVCHRRILG
jgi:hypothetical protein